MIALGGCHGWRKVKECSDSRIVSEASENILSSQEKYFLKLPILFSLIEFEWLQMMFPSQGGQQRFLLPPSSCETFFISHFLSHQLTILSCPTFLISNYFPNRVYQLCVCSQIVRAYNIARNGQLYFHIKTAWYNWHRFAWARVTDSRNRRNSIFMKFLGSLNPHREYALLGSLSNDLC